MSDAPQEKLLVVNALNLSDAAEDLRERIIFLCEKLTAGRGIYDQLESLTSIGASKWKNLFLRRQMPTIEMLVAMCNHMPPYSLWLVLGPSNDSKMMDLNQVAPVLEDWNNFVAHRSWVFGKR